MGVIVEPAVRVRPGRYIDQFLKSDNCTEEVNWYNDMTKLLIPDTSIEDPKPDFIWCAPVAAREWNDLARLADNFKCVSPNGMRFLHRIGARRQRIIIVPWRVKNVPDSTPVTLRKIPALSKEEIEQECAWLRLIKDIQHPIYVVPHGVELTTREIIQRSMGVLPGTIQSLDSLKEVPIDPDQ